MNKAKRRKLERRGWKVGSASEFLGLTAEEARFIELKLTLSRWLRERREALKLTQVGLAQRLQSSQSRIAKMEAGDPSVLRVPRPPDPIALRPRRHQARSRPDNRYNKIATRGPTACEGGVSSGARAPDSRPACEVWLPESGGG